MITADSGRRVAPARVPGIDASAAVIEEARRDAGGGPNVEFLVGDLYALEEELTVDLDRNPGAPHTEYTLIATGRSCHRRRCPDDPRCIPRALRGPVRELLINVKARELMAIAGGVLKQRREECVGEAPTSPLWSRLDTHGRPRHHPPSSAGGRSTSSALCEGGDRITADM